MYKQTTHLGLLVLGNQPNSFTVKVKSYVPISRVDSRSNYNGISISCKCNSVLFIFEPNRTKRTWMQFLGVEGVKPLLVVEPELEMQISLEIRKDLIMFYFCLGYKVSERRSFQNKFQNNLCYQVRRNIHHSYHMELK